MPHIYNEKIADNGVSIHTGFPNPAIDTALKDLDLNQLLIAHSASSYMMRIEGESWQHLGIFNNDIAIIDRSLTARPNDIVVWWKDDSFVLSHLSQAPKEAVVFGTVTSTIHIFKDIT